jgi:hypothetical protein
MGGLCGGVRSTTGVPQRAADLLHRTSWQTRTGSDIKHAVSQIPGLRRRPDSFSAFALAGGHSPAPSDNAPRMTAARLDEGKSACKSGLQFYGNICRPASLIGTRMTLVGRSPASSALLRGQRGPVKRFTTMLQLIQVMFVRADCHSRIFPWMAINATSVSRGGLRAFTMPLLSLDDYGPALRTRSIFE